MSPEIPNNISTDPLKPKPQTEANKQEIYIRGDIELEDKFCSCGRHIVRSVRLIKIFKNGSCKISVDEQCPSEGLLNHQIISIKPDQLRTT